MFKHSNLGSHIKNPSWFIVDNGTHELERNTFSKHILWYFIYNVCLSQYLLKTEIKTSIDLKNFRFSKMVLAN